MTAYNIFDAADPKDSIATIDAADEYEALAEYSISQGFSDPRNVPNDEDGYFTTWFDGTIGMVYTNTELVAVAA